MKTILAQAPYPMSEKSLEIAILTLLIVIALFLLLRGLNNWYWKINERIRLQKETNKLLSKLVELNSIPEDEEKQLNPESQAGSNLKDIWDNIKDK